MNGTVWLGADRFEGFGKCSVTELQSVPGPDWAEGYAIEQPGEELYLLAVSPLTMLGETGEPCGLNLAALADKLGVERVEAPFCGTALAEFGGYNRTWKCRAPAVTMYDRGSLFHLSAPKRPPRNDSVPIEREGLGVRRGEGFGQVLFLSPERFENLRNKASVERPVQGRENRSVRDGEYRWVMDHADKVRQCGAVPQPDRHPPGPVPAGALPRRGRRALYAHLDKNLHDRGARHGKKFEEMAALVHQVLDRPLAQTLGLEDCPDRRLELLNLLFDYSRKRNDGEER